MIADGNFPAESVGKDGIVIRMDGHGTCEVLEAVLQLFPLDTYVEQPFKLMQVMEGDPVETPIWEKYKDMIKRFDERGERVMGEVERFEFYEQARTAYAVIATGEEALYANIMLQKGVVTM